MDEIPQLQSHTPPDWSLLTGQIGRVSVYASVVLFCIAFLAWLFAKRNENLGKVGIWSFGLGCLGILTTFGSLAALFVGNRFEFEYVWGHADLGNAVPYRIAGIWSGQQGSFLLWGLCAAVFGILVARGAGAYRRWFTIVYSIFLAAICAILAYESPFNLVMADGKAFVPDNGMGLAPSLQNYWVIIHPPTIFLGFGSLTALFALAVAAMAIRNYDEWIPIIRPWAIVSMTLVGVGLCMGGFWAYETLGWGGFWMWDPVENVSFVPWCLTAALVHGVIVQTTRKRWKTSNLLMAGAPFIAFVYGTFLTRSGFLADASVHSFAEMDRSALKLLIGVMGLTTIGFLGQWAFRAIQDKKALTVATDLKGGHREGFYRAGSILLTAMGLATMIGMSVPLFMALAGNPPKVVEEKTYHLVLPWIFIPIMIVMAVAPFVGWKGMPAKEIIKKAYSPLCITIGVTGFVMMAIALSPLGKIANLNQPITFPGGMQVRGLPWVMFLSGICTFVLVANLWRFIEIVKRSKLGVSSFVTHMGVAILMSGLIISRGFERHDQTLVSKDRPGRILNYEINYAGMTSNTHDRNNKVKFNVTDAHKGDKVLFTATPGFYYNVSMNGQESPMVWPHIQRFASHDFYLSMQPPETQTGEELSLAPGKSIDLGNFNLKYKEMTRVGEPGAPGTKFGALVEVTTPKGKQTLNPTMELGAGGPPIQHPAKLSEGLNIAMVGMDVATKSVTLQVQSTNPVYPIEVYQKPLTGLVWLGTGVMTFGGFLSAFYRRRVRKLAGSESAQAETEAELTPSTGKTLVTT